MSADVDDKINVRHKVFGGGKVRYGFDNAVIHAECTFDNVLAVARGRDRRNLNAGAAAVNVQKQLSDDGNGVAAVGLISGVKQRVVFADNGRFHGGGTGVDADVHRPAFGGKLAARHTGGRVAAVKFFVLFAVFEQRRIVRVRSACTIIGKALCHVLERKLLRGIQRRAQRYIIKTIIGASAGDAQRFVEAGAQNGQKCQRAAQIQNIAFNFAPLRKARNRLVHDGEKDAGRDIARLCALVDQRLNVTFGKHAAARSDGIRFFCRSGGFVHFVRRHF